MSVEQDTVLAAMLPVARRRWVSVAQARTALMALLGAALLGGATQAAALLLPRYVSCESAEAEWSRLYDRYIRRPRR